MTICDFCTIAGADTDSEDEERAMLEDGQSEGDYSDQDSPRRRGGDDESNGSLTPSGSSQSESEPEGDYSDEEDTEE